LIKALKGTSMHIYISIRAGSIYGRGMLQSQPGLAELAAPKERPGGGQG
jgi:hypothetical protein